MSKMRMWSAQWIMRIGSTRTGRESVALPSRSHTHTIIAATGTKKMADS